MITLLAKIFIKSKEECDIRSAYGKLCSIVGILLNILLFALKLIKHRFFLASVYCCDFLFLEINMGIIVHILNRQKACIIFALKLSYIVNKSEALSVI